MMKRLLFALTGLGLLSLTGTTIARDVEADPNKDYPVTPDIGPWMICVHAYTGSNAGPMAHDLVLEIRQKYNLPAYAFNRGAEEHRKQQEEINRIQQMCPGGRVRIVRIEEQFAVLVGGYKDMDAARSALNGIKKLKMPDPQRVRVDWTWIYNTKDQALERTLVNPFLHSFVVRNPVAPKEPLPDNGDDYVFMKKLNADEPYSLLKCGKPWTLAIASFEGGTVLRDKDNSGSFFDKLWRRDGGERLSAAAMNAHTLAKALRDDSQTRLNAYVLHTRYQSVVSIGGYDRPDDPKMNQDSLFIKRMKIDQSNPFFIQPRPMEVPHP